MPSELSAASEWIINRLKTDPILQDLIGGRVYYYTIPQNGVMPCIVVAPIDNLPRKGTGDRRILERIWHRVEAVAESFSFEDVKPISDQIDELLDLGQELEDGSIAVGISRDKETERPDDELGRVIKGGIYTGMVQFI